MPEELLVGISGVGVAIAGFSGIAIVLRARDGAEWAKVANIKAVLETSLTACVFALLPMGVQYFVSNTNMGLAVLTVAFGLWHAWILWVALRRNHLTAILQLWQWDLGSPIVFGAIFVIAAQLVIGIGMIADYLWAAYLLGLFWLIIVSLMNFSMFVYSSLGAASEEP